MKKHVFLCMSLLCYSMSPSLDSRFRVQNGSYYLLTNDFISLLASVKKQDHIKTIKSGAYSVVLVNNHGRADYEIEGLPAGDRFCMFSAIDNNWYQLITNSEQLFEVAGERHPLMRELLLVLDPSNKIQFCNLPTFDEKEERREEDFEQPDIPPFNLHQ